VDDWVKEKLEQVNLGCGGEAAMERSTSRNGAAIDSARTITSAHRGLPE
jgi:hypothetical protein